MRQLPAHKTQGTGYNLRPTTERVPAAALRVARLCWRASSIPPSSPASTAVMTRRS